MISLKFIDGILHQSIQINPGGRFTDYSPVPSENTLVESQVKEEVHVHKYEPNLSKFGEYSGCACGHRYYVGSTVEDSKMGWGCEHTQYNNALYNFCPICGTPRPKPLSLREELTEKLINSYKEQWNLRDTAIYKPDFELFADIAIKHLQNKWVIDEKG